MTHISTLATLFLYSTLATCLTFKSTEKQKPVQPEPAPINGIAIPPIGLGLWNSHDKSATHAVKSALHNGYTHFDSAAAYSNEDYVGSGLSSPTNNLSRSDYWLTSKLWNTHHRPKLVHEAINQTLHDLNTTHLDLYLMHWPVAFIPDAPSGRTILDQDVSITETWKAMESLVHANLTRYIGVSNFSPRQLDEILKNCEICPYAHEFEIHPYLQQQQFVEWHQKKNISVIAYSPLGNLNPTYKGVHSDIPSILEDKFWLEMAEKKNCTVPQAVLAWGRQRGTVVIPKSVHKKRIKENLGSLTVRLSEDEMAKIGEQDRRARFNDPSKGWGVELFEGLDDGSNRFLLEEERLEL